MADDPKVTTFPLPSVVYHYCSEEAALGIIESGCIWLTNQAGLSDSHDSKWAVPWIQTHLNKRVNDANRATIRDFWNFYSANTPDVYVASFSAVRDLLSQWRAYADDGAGVALGFDPRYFGVHQVMTPKVSVVPEHSIGMMKVLYDDSLLEENLGSVFDELAAQRLPYEPLGVMVRGLTLTCKNPAFSEEREWRLVYSPLMTTDAKGSLQIIGRLTDLLFRETKYGIYPYFKIPFNAPAIREIVLGPKCKTPASIAKLMLDRFGHTGAEVLKSRASYR